MAKAKKTDAADAARRRRVEALRDDCRRHQDGCVRIAFNEGGSVRLTGDEGRWVRRLLKNHRAPEDHRTIEMALKSAGLDASQRAIALLARMGTLIAATKDEANEFEDPTDHAMYTLAMRAPGRTSFFNPSEPLFFPAIPESTARTKEEHIKQAKAAALAAGLKEQTVREVPDVRAAIAEFCEELLEEKPQAKRRKVNWVDMMHRAVLTLQTMRQGGTDPTDRAIAEALGIPPQTFSRNVGQTGYWIEAKAGRLATQKRERSRDQNTWTDRG